MDFKEIMTLIVGISAITGAVITIITRINNNIEEVAKAIRAETDGKIDKIIETLSKISESITLINLTLQEHKFELKRLDNNIRSLEQSKCRNQELINKMAHDWAKDIQELKSPG